MPINNPEEVKGEKWREEFRELSKIGYPNHNCKPLESYISDLLQSQRKEFLQALEKSVPESRGTEEQYSACGLYHWNECLVTLKENLKSNGIEIK